RGWDKLAEVAESRGQIGRARSLYRRVLTLRRRSLGPTHADVAWTLTNLARMSLASGDIAEADHTIARAIAIFRALGRQANLARAVAVRGEIEGRRGDYAAARASFAEALKLRESIFGASHPVAAETRAQLAAVDFALGAYDTALRETLDAEKAGRDHL